MSNRVAYARKSQIHGWCDYAYIIHLCVDMSVGVYIWLVNYSIYIYIYSTGSNTVFISLSIRCNLQCFRLGKMKTVSLGEHF